MLESNITKYGLAVQIMTEREVFSVKGLITDIQRFSLHDGPGIRTTVFLKGCNLSCAWCHNPETIHCNPELLFYESKCIGCLHCVEVCPSGAQTTINHRHVFLRDLCIHCGQCAAVCYPGASVMAGQEITATDVLKQVLLDEAYYKQSGGGVTISGGEVLVQKDFTYEILKLCRDKNIHTAIETNLASAWENIQALVPVLDLLMLDIKHSDEREHCQWTGSGNAFVFDNLQKLSRVEIPLIIRTPVIPGVNDAEEVIRKIALFISKLPNVQYYELLKFNPLGDAKYQALGKANPFKETHLIEDEMMERLANSVHGLGVRIKIG
jgi:glycyl-radical enzyme activating protein